MKSDQNTTDELLNPLIPPSTPLIGMQRPNECRQAGLMRRAHQDSEPSFIARFVAKLVHVRFHPSANGNKKMLEIFGFVSDLKIHGPNLKTASLPFVK